MPELIFQFGVAFAPHFFQRRPAKPRRHLIALDIYTESVHTRIVL